MHAPRTARASLGSSKEVSRQQVGTAHSPACSINLRPGAFAQYITAPYDLVWLVPDHMSLESASTISMCGLTAAQGVFARLGMPAPFPTTPAGAFLPSLSSSDPVNVLIYGASTSLGMYAAQMVRASSRVSGRKIRLIGTASAGKHAFLRAKPYAYDVLIDYRAPDWPAQVAKATAGAGVAYALDTISEGPTVPAIESTLAQQDARMAVFRQPEGGGYDVSKLRIKPIYGAVWEGLGVEVQYSSGLSIPADPAARAFAAAFFEALSDGTLAIMPNPVRLMPGGLANVVADGFVLIGDALFSARGGDKGRTEGHMKPISGEKLVYQVEQ